MSEWTFFSCQDKDGLNVIDKIHGKLASLNEDQAATAKLAISDIHSREARGVVFWQENADKSAETPRIGSGWNQRIFFTNQGYESDLYEEALALLNGNGLHCELKPEEALNSHITMTNQRNGDAILTVWWPSNEKLETPSLNRRYDRTTFAMAHDAHTAMPLTHQQVSSQKVKARTALPIDQSRSQEEQFFDGIRAFRITSDLIDGKIRLHHNKALYQKITTLTKYVKDLTFVPIFPINLIGIATNLYSLISGDDQTDVQVQTVFSPLEDYLKNVKKFLDANPNEIVSYLDEGDAYADKAKTKLIVDIYKRVFGSDSSGNPNMVYTHTVGQSWPTLQEMVDQNRRLVLFSSSVTPKVHQELPQAKFVNKMWNSSAMDGNIWENDYEHYDPNKPVTWTCKPDQVGGVHAPNRLYLYNHFYYTPGVQFWPEVIRKVISDVMKKKIDMSDPTKSYATVGRLLQEDVEIAALELGHPPNFINVDFYQGVNGARSTLIPVVNKMNRSWGEPIPGPTGDLIRDLGSVKEHLLKISNHALRDVCLTFVEEKIHPAIAHALGEIKNDLNGIEPKIALMVNPNKKIPEEIRPHLEAMYAKNLENQFAQPTSNWGKSVTSMQQDFATFAKAHSKPNDVTFLQDWLQTYIWSAKSMIFEGTDLWQARQDLIHQAVTHLGSGQEMGDELHAKTEELIKLSSIALDALANV